MADDFKTAKAEAKAAEARAKAMRPWYKKKVILIPAIIILLIIIVKAAGGGGGDSTSSGDPDAPKVVEVNIPGEATLNVGKESTKTAIGAPQVKARYGDNEYAAASTGKKYISFPVTIENVGTDDIDLNGSVYRLQIPSGEIIDYECYSCDEGKSIESGTTLPPGVKKEGLQLTWEIPEPKAGDKFILLWKPSPYDKAQAKFTYIHA